jgi:TRAP-type mannitol/chloroaromatic compound transport system substrate-binding protein
MVSFLAGSVFAADPQWKWKAQALWSPQETPYKLFVKFAERVKEMTGGRLEMTVYHGGGVVANTEGLDALKNNVVQAFFNAPSYYAGRNPAFSALTDLSMAWDDSLELDLFIHYGGGLELLRELYKPFGVYVVETIQYPVESYPSKRPLRKIEDFKGLKIRVPQGMENDVLTKLGASTIVLPGTEVYSALDKGVIDATNWNTVANNEALGYHKIAPYFTYPGFHSKPWLDFAVNEREWNKLPQDVKLIVETAVCRLSQEVVSQCTFEDTEVVRSAQSKGYTVISWSNEEKIRMRKVAREVWEEWKKKNAQSKKAIELQEDFLKKMGRLD